MAFASLRVRELKVIVSSDAQTAGDALRLAHDGGVESGFVQPMMSGMRFNPAFLNPGTTFAVAYVDDEPIASLVLTEDGPFGLPADRAFIEEIDAFRLQGDSIFEAGAWMIARDWRRHTVLVGSSLFGAAMRMNIGSPEPRRMIVVVEPHRVRMVAEIFANELITEERPYLGLPGTLIVTRPSLDWASHFMDAGGFSPRRVVAERVFEPDPTWLQIGRDGVHWTEALLPPLLAESNVEQMLEAQLSLVRDPLSAIARADARPVIA